MVLEKVMTDKVTDRQTDRNSFLSLDPFCGRGRVKKTFIYIVAQLHSSSNMGKVNYKLFDLNTATELDFNKA